MRTILIRVLRACFGAWPFLHGRGWILRVARLLLGPEPVRFDIGGGTIIEGRLDDWMILWTFMRLHERDAPFQHSLDLLRPGGVALDVGANVGIWSLLAAKRGVHVHAFEPVPAMAERLRGHVASNSARPITLYQLALSAECGSRPFFAVVEGNSGASALVRRHNGDVEIQVEIATLDSVLEHEKIDRVDFMKVDVEGAEILVFRGASRLMTSESAPIVFFEVDDQLCASFGTTSREIKQLLAEYGYAIYRWHDARLASVTVEERHGHEDLFALRPQYLTKNPG
jgi:FkbM family methyltransferase